MSRNTPLAFIALTLAACSGGMDSTSPMPLRSATDAPSFSEHSDPFPTGAVYTLSNSTAGNSVIVFARAHDGTLSPRGLFATGGNGTGAGLGSQGAVTLSENRKWLFAVNAASNTISSFAVDGTNLALIGAVPSGGTTPISLTVDKDLLYVLNGGGAGNIVGFSISHEGELTMLPGSARPLSGAAVGPAQVGFDPSGDWLVVTEKNTNKIDVYSVDKNGYATGPSVNPSSGPTPFGFAFTKQGVLVVSEAFGGAPNASAASSYDIDKHGTLTTISASVPTTETAACWVAVTENGKFAYTSNAASASVTGFEVRHGELSRVTADGRTGETGAGALDAAVSRDSKYLYVLESGAHGISAFSVRHDGSLEKLTSATGLPVGAIGLAAQ